MSDLTIRTNNVPRQLIYGYELTAKEKADFDYISEEEIDLHDFFRYKGIVYDPSEFMRISENAPEAMRKYDGYMSDSYFSGILIKYNRDMDAVIVAQYFS
jgi:hypothetical protein